MGSSERNWYSLMLSRVSTSLARLRPRKQSAVAVLASWVSWNRVGPKQWSLLVRLPLNRSLQLRRESQHFESVQGGYHRNCLILVSSRPFIPPLAFAKGTTSHLSSPT